MCLMNTTVIKNLQDKIDCLQEELRGRGKEIAQLESALFVVWKKTQRDFLSGAGAPENRSSSADPTLTRFSHALPPLHVTLAHTHTLDSLTIDKGRAGKLRWDMAPLCHY